MKAVFFLLVVLLAGGCASSSRIDRLSLGMTKAEVIEIMGAPVKTSAVEGSEYIAYRLYPYSVRGETTAYPNREISSPYYVRLVGGIVNGYGYSRDFGLGVLPPAARIQDVNFF